MSDEKKTGRTDDYSFNVLDVVAPRSPGVLSINFAKLREFTFEHSSWVLWYIHARYDRLLKFFATTPLGKNAQIHSGNVQTQISQFIHPDECEWDMPSYEDVEWFFDQTARTAPHEVEQEFYGTVREWAAAESIVHRIADDGFPKAQLGAALGAFMTRHPEQFGIVEYPRPSAPLTIGHSLIREALRPCGLLNDLSRIVYEYAPDLSIRPPPAHTLVVLNGQSKFMSDQMEWNIGFDQLENTPRDITLAAFLAASVIYQLTQSPYSFFQTMDVDYDMDNVIIGARFHQINQEYLIAIGSPYCNDLSDDPSVTGCRESKIPHDVDSRCAAWICPLCLAVQIDQKCKRHVSGWQFGTRFNARFVHHVWCSSMHGIEPRRLNGLGIAGPVFDIPTSVQIQQVLAARLKAYPNPSFAGVVVMDG